MKGDTEKLYFIRCPEFALWDPQVQWETLYDL